MLTAFEYRNSRGMERMEEGTRIQDGGLFREPGSRAAPRGKVVGFVSSGEAYTGLAMTLATVTGCLVVLLGFPLYAQAVDPLNARIAECGQARDGECLLTLAEFIAAADAFEVVAREPTGHPRASASLARAVRLRRELGQETLAMRDADDFRRRFPDHPRLADVASEVFQLGALYLDRGQPDQAIAHYQMFLREWGKVGGEDLPIVAHVRLAELLLDQSCPVAGVRGACVELAQTPTPCPFWYLEGARQAAACTYQRRIVIRHRRDPQLTKDANVHLGAAAQLSKAAAVHRVGRDDLADALAGITLLSAQAEQEAYFALGGMPEGLDFTPPATGDPPGVARMRKRTFTLSNQRFMAWLVAKTVLLQRLEKSYRRAARSAGLVGRVTAAGLFAEVYEDFAQSQYEWEEARERRYPGVMDLGSGIQGKLEPIEAKIVSALEACLAFARASGTGGEWFDYCQDRISKYRPGDYPKLVERVPLFERDIPVARPSLKPEHDPATAMPSPVIPARRLGKREDHQLASIFARDPSIELSALTKVGGRP